MTSEVGQPRQLLTGTPKPARSFELEEPTNTPTPTMRRPTRPETTILRRLAPPEPTTCRRLLKTPARWVSSGFRYPSMGPRLTAGCRLPGRSVTP